MLVRLASSILTETEGFKLVATASFILVDQALRKTWWAAIGVLVIGVQILNGGGMCKGVRNGICLGKGVVGRDHHDSQPCLGTCLPLPSMLASDPQHGWFDDPTLSLFGALQSAKSQRNGQTKTR